MQSTFNTDKENQNEPMDEPSELSSQQYIEKHSKGDEKGFMETNLIEVVKLTFIMSMCP